MSPAGQQPAHSVSRNPTSPPSVLSKTGGRIFFHFDVSALAEGGRLNLSTEGAQVFLPEAAPESHDRRYEVGMTPLAEWRERVRSLYDLIADRYDAGRNLWERSLGGGVEAVIDRWVQEYVPHVHRVLDLGCGTGANLARLMRLGRSDFEYTGVDASRAMLAIARTKFGSRPGACFLEMDLEALDGLRGTYDLVISTYVLSHVRNPSLAIGVALSKVAPGGWLLLADLSDPPLPIRPFLRPLETLLWFRFVPSSALSPFRHWREKAVFLGGTLTAVALRGPGQ